MLFPILDMLNISMEVMFPGLKTEHLKEQRINHTRKKKKKRENFN